MYNKTSKWALFMYIDHNANPSGKHFFITTLNTTSVFLFLVEFTAGEYEENLTVLLYYY